MRRWIAIGGLLWACGGEDEGSRAIAAAEGGQVALGGATLDIPPGALPADATVTLRRQPVGELPPLADADPEAITIEPVGIALERPATLTLEVDDPPPALLEV